MGIPRAGLPGDVQLGWALPGVANLARSDVRRKVVAGAAVTLLRFARQPAKYRGGRYSAGHDGMRA